MLMHLLEVAPLGERDTPRELKTRVSLHKNEDFRAESVGVVRQNVLQVYFLFLSRADSTYCRKVTPD